jgi:hypothetical protein
MKYFLDIRLPNAIATDHDGMEFETAADAILAARAEAEGLERNTFRRGPCGKSCADERCFWSDDCRDTGRLEKSTGRLTGPPAYRLRSAS